MTKSDKRSAFGAKKSVTSFLTSIVLAHGRSDEELKKIAAKYEEPSFDMF